MTTNMIGNVCHTRWLKVVLNIEKYITTALPGNFFVRKDAFVIIDFDIVTVVVAGDSATLIPIGPSHGWPKIKS